MVSLPLDTSLWPLNGSNFALQSVLQEHKQISRDEVKDMFPLIPRRGWTSKHFSGQNAPKLRPEWAQQYIKSTRLYNPTGKIYWSMQDLVTVLNPGDDENARTKYGQSSADSTCTKFLGCGFPWCSRVMERHIPCPR